MPKYYCYDIQKDRYVAKCILKGVKTYIGTYKTEEDAQIAVKKFLTKIIMPPKNKRKLSTSYTLKDALSFYDSLKNPDGTKQIWKRSLISLIANAEENTDDLTNGELGAKYETLDIVPLLKDFEKTTDVIENQILNSRTGQPIAIDTKKQYFSSIFALFSKKAKNLVLSKELEDRYKEKVQEYDKLSNDKRDKQLPQKANLLYPNFTWDVIQEEYNQYIDTKPFTNTEKGRKELRNACVVGLYVLQRPRRCEDYELLQYYSKVPTEKEREGKNILVIDKNNATLYIDKFKTRFRVTNEKKKELLPQYVKDVNSRLASLLRMYIKNFDIKDMSKLTPQEKRQKKEYYMFHKETATQDQLYSKGGFSDHVTACMKAVFGKPKLSVNTFRHAFNDWVMENIKQFDEFKRKQISVDVGDTPQKMPTHARYRIANPEMENIEKTQIEEILHDDAYAKKLHDAQAEEGGSVANETPQMNDVEDIVSPQVQPNIYLTNLDELYRQYGETMFKLKKIEANIQIALNQQRQ